MTHKRRNAFWSFVFAFIPGCTEMYWGFMKMGMSLLLPFILIAAIAIALEIEVILFVDIVIYVFGFFHARNLVHMSDEELAETPDEPVQMFDSITKPFDFVKKNDIPKWVGALLVVLGIYIVLNQLNYFFPYDSAAYWIYERVLRLLPKCVAAGLVIRFGIALIAGKKEESEKEIKEVKKEEN